MYWDIVDVRPEGGYSLFVTFSDGIGGHVRFNPEQVTGALEPLRDPAFFKRAFLDHGAVAWPGEIDLAPNATYEAVKRARTGEEVPLSAYPSSPPGRKGIVPIAVGLDVRDGETGVWTGYARIPVHVNVVPIQPVRIGVGADVRANIARIAICSPVRQGGTVSAAD